MLVNAWLSCCQACELLGMPKKDVLNHFNCQSKLASLLIQLNAPTKKCGRPSIEGTNAGPSKKKKIYPEIVNSKKKSALDKLICTKKAFFNIKYKHIGFKSSFFKRYLIFIFLMLLHNESKSCMTLIPHSAQIFDC